MRNGAPERIRSSAPQIRSLARSDRNPLVLGATSKGRSPCSVIENAAGRRPSVLGHLRRIRPQTKVV